MSANPQSCLSCEASRHTNIHRDVYLWLYSPCGPWPLFQFLNLHTVSRTPWTGDQPVARLLPTHKTTQTQIKRTQTSIPLVGFEHTISVRTGGDSSCLRQRGHYDRRTLRCVLFIMRLFYLLRGKKTSKPILCTLFSVMLSKFLFALTLLSYRICVGLYTAEHKKAWIGQPSQFY
jgi:hypothetical protein